MPRKTHFCENHSGIKTTIKCHQCNKYICKQCELVLDERSFCSEACQKTYRRFQAAEKRRQQREKVLILFTGFFKQGGFKKTFQIVITLYLIFSVVQIVSLQRSLKTLEAYIKTGLTTDAAIDTSGLLDMTLFEPAEGGMVTTNQIDIQGLADENWVVTLMKDDKVQAVQLPVNGTFLFKDIELTRGVNRLSVRALDPNGKMTQLQTLLFTYAPPTRKYLAEDIRRGPLNKKQLAFTFDGGAENNIAEEIVNYLKENQIHCTFFLTGYFIRNYPNLVRRIVKEGHEVGNHTWSHPHLTSFADDRRHHTLPNITRERLQEELNKTAKLFEMVTGKKMAGLWRAPFGEINKEINEWAAEAGYKHIGWTTGNGWEQNMDTMDWVADKASKAYHTADEIADKVLAYGDQDKLGANGAIILMHLGSNREDDYPHQKLSEMIQGLRKKGYAPVTVSDMLLLR